MSQSHIKLKVPRAVLRDTFAELRRCGAGRRECQVLWVGPWADESSVRVVVHPKHRAHGGGFELDSAWLTAFWNELLRTRAGVRAQIHTHPGRAFHSPIDDAWPIVHVPGFLSLVIPNFASGEADFRGAYLTQIQNTGVWKEVRIDDHIEVVE